MLFTQHINTLNSGISSIQSRIDELEALLKGLRNDKATLEAELQTVLTLEGAAESALSQSQSFINAAESLGRTDLIETFWQAMDAMKNGAIAKLPETTPENETTPEPEPTPEPQNPTDDDDAITVEVTDTDFTPEPEPTPTPTPTPTSEHEHQPQSVGSAFNTKDATLEEIKAYVRSHQSDDKTKTQGSLTRKSTWVMAAKQIQKISDYTP